MKRLLLSCVFSLSFVGVGIATSGCYGECGLLICPPEPAPDPSPGSPSGGHEEPDDHPPAFLGDDGDNIIWGTFQGPPPSHTDWIGCASSVVETQVNVPVDVSVVAGEDDIHWYAYPDGSPPEGHGATANVSWSSPTIGVVIFRLQGGVKAACLVSVRASHP